MYIGDVLYFNTHIPRLYLDVATRWDRCGERNILYYFEIDPTNDYLNGYLKTKTETLTEYFHRSLYSLRLL